MNITLLGLCVVFGVGFFFGSLIALWSADRTWQKRFKALVEEYFLAYQNHNEVQMHTIKRLEEEHKAKLAAFVESKRWKI